MSDVTKRADAPKEVTLVGQDAPSWLLDAAKDDQSLVGTAKLKLLARMKRVQDQGKKGKELCARHGVGSLLIMPDEICLAKSTEVVQFVPLYFFEEFTSQGNIKDKGGKFIREQTFDMKSDLAAAAQDPERRTFQYQGGDGSNYEGRNVHHLCFFSVIYGNHPARGSIFVLSFEKGEFTAGQKFISQLHARRAGASPMPLWSQVWGLTPIHRSREFEWEGADTVPVEGLMHIAEDEVASFKLMHETAKADHAAKAFRVQRDDEGEDGADTSGDDPSVKL